MFSWAKNVSIILICYKNIVLRVVGIDLHACMWAYVFSLVQLFVTTSTVVHQVLVSMEFSRQEYWSGLLFPTPRDLPDPGIKPSSPVSPELQADSFYC